MSAKQRSNDVRSFSASAKEERDHQQQRHGDRASAIVESWRRRWKCHRKLHAIWETLV